MIALGNYTYGTDLSAFVGLVCEQQNHLALPKKLRPFLIFLSISLSCFRSLTPSLTYFLRSLSLDGGPYHCVEWVGNAD